VLGKENDSNIPRLGLAVSKRVATKAVARNRLKRLAREAFRCQNGLPDWDFVVIARPAAEAEGNNILKKSLEKHFQRLMQKADDKRNGQS
jgi:ribonuclease P protein component